jgi:hypothetical protein
MGWSDPIDIYCERTDPSLWAEPINAASNLGFLIAALLAFRQWRRRGGADHSVLALIVLVALIGIGSFLFHTFATEAASILDVVPITLFVSWFFYLALRRFLKVSVGLSVALLTAFLGLSQAMPSIFPAAFLNGSDAYLPPLFALVAIGASTPDPARRRSLLLTAALFAISLALRTIDLAICDSWPIGTHFVWHLLNAVVLYRLVMTTFTPAKSL